MQSIFSALARKIKTSFYYPRSLENNLQKGFVNPVAIGIIAIVVVVVIMFGYYIIQKEPREVNDKTTQEKAMMQKDETSMTEAEKMEQKAMMEKKAMEEKEAMTKTETMTKVGSYEAYSSEKVAMASATHQVVLFFRAGWCPSCRAVDADIKANMSKIPASLTILDVDYDNSTALKQKYGVTYQHTFVQVDSNGNLIKKWSGSPTLSALVVEVK